MRLRKIRLHNFKQHRDLEKTIDGNIIAVIGPNGRGKSNLIGAVQFALAGEQPGFKKDELTTWGESEGYAFVEFEHDGLVWELIRYTSKTLAILNNDAGEQWASVSAVDKVLRERVGLDPDILRQSVFVNQSEIDAVLFSLPRERELAFQRQVGLGHSQKLYDILTRKLSQIPEPENLDQAASVHITALASLDAEAEAAKAGIGEDNADRVRELKETVRQTEAELTRSRKIAGLRTLEQGRIQAQELLLAQRQDPVPAPDTERMRVLESETEAFRAQLQVVASARAAFRNHASRASELEAAKAALASLPAPESPLPLMEKEELLREVRAKVQELKVGRELRLKLKDAVSSSGACPLCGSSVAGFLGEQLFDTRTIDVELKKLTDSERALVQDVAETRRRLTAAETARAAAQSRLDAAVRAMPAAPEYSEDVLATAEKTLAENHASASAELSGLREQAVKHAAVRDATLKLEIAAADIDSEIERIRKQLSEIPEAGTVSELEARLTDSARRLEEAKALHSRRVSLLENIQALENRRLVHVKALDDIAGKRKAQERLVKLRDRLSRCRSWFHYENGPHTVTITVMDALTPQVNHFLAQMSAPFVVVPDYDGVGFRYRKLDNADMPDPLPTARSLSGAQKNMLAAAFRLASYTMFSSKSGMLVLDEPTAHLDSENVSKVGELLSSVQKIAADMDLQIIIVTHHSEILPFCDSVIDLGSE